MKKRFRLASLLLAVMLMGSSLTVYADENVDEVENAEQTEGEEAAEGEEGAEEEATEESAGELVMSSLTASNGLTIAQSIPDNLIPEGFHKTTVQYSGQTVDVAYMDSDSYGEVVLSYLANADGSNGDFYLCDINTAEMSDFVKITNGEGKFIVVLDPGDTVVAPSGFIKATLNWHGKNVTAWALPKDNADSEKEEKDKEEASAFATLEVYALDITAGASDSEEEEATAEETDTEEPSEEEKSDKKDKKEEEKTAAEPEDGSRVEYAPSGDFFLIYAIDQDGVVGFYLYDIVGETFQRYVEISNGDMELLSQYRKEAKLRLMIIVILAVILVVAIIVIINLATKSGGSGKKTSRRRYDYDDEDDEEYDEDDDDEDEDDEDDEIEQMRRRVAKKERRHIKQGRRELNYLMDIDDEDDEEDDEDDDDEEVFAPRRARREAPSRRRVEVKREVVEPEEDEEEEEVFEAPIRRKSVTVANAAPVADDNIRRPVKKSPRSGISIEPEPDLDLDDDFEFEFLDLK